MSFRDFSRRSTGSSGGSRKSIPQRTNSIAVNRATQKQISSNSIQNSFAASVETACSNNLDSHSSLPSNTIDNSRDEHALNLSQQREEDFALQLMREREQELRDINHKMHVVNEIYKDLGEVVSGQQEQIDTIENQFGNAAENSRRGLEQLEKANSKGQKKNPDTNDEDKDDTRQDECQFFLLKYVQNKMCAIGKMVSICGGSASANYSLGEDD